MIKINELNKHFEEEVVISGFVDEIRNLKWVQFVVLRDETGKVQITIEKSEEANKELVEIIDNLTVESTLKVTGKVMDSPKVKLNGMEVIPSKIEVTSVNQGELPFNYKDISTVNLDTRLDYRYIDLRSEKNILMFQIQSTLVRYMREYLYNNGFTEIHSPKLLGAASESGSEVFEVKYFDKKAYLAQSPQFYKQMALAAGFGKVFEVAPCFRAENSNTSRHATEFTSFDLEMAYIDDFNDVMDLEAEMLAYAFEKTNEVYGEKIKEVFETELVVPKTPFPKMRLADIYKELEERYDYKIDDSEKNDLTTEAERLCYKLSMDKFNSEFLFVIDFPAEKRAFYHMRDDPGILQGYD